MMSTNNHVNELADVWAFVVGHMALQAAVVAAVLVILAVWGRRWPAPIRHGLLLLALLKFAIPPVTNLPVGIFSVWHTESSINEVQTPKYAASRQGAEFKSASINASPIRRDGSGKFEGGASLQNVAEVETESHDVVTMRDLLNPDHVDKDSTDRVDSDGNINQSNNHDSESHVVVHADALTGQTYTPDATPDNPDQASLTVSAWLMIIHGIGSLIFAVALFWTARTLRRFIKSTVPAPEAIQANFQALSNNLGSRSNIELRISPENVTPFSTGVLSPVIVVSEQQLNFLHADQLEAVLLHELVHHRRNDLLICWCQAIVTLFWWFHPAVWIVNRQIRALREDCCDDFLLCRNAVEPGVYCETLLNVARGCNDRSHPLQVMTVSMAHGVHSLNSRFRRIMDERQTRKTRISMAGAMGLLLVGLLFMPGMTTAASRAEEIVVNVAATLPAATEANVKAATETEQKSEPTAVVAKWPESIRVTVLDPDGKPIEGAKVIQTINRPETEFITDVDGEAIVPVPEDPSNVTYMAIEVDAAPYVVFEKYWYPQRWPERPIEAAYEFRLEEGQTVGGRVINADNQPIVGAKVYVESSPDNGNRPAPRPTSHTFVAETDETGHWIQNRIPKSLEGLALQVHHPDYTSNPYPVGTKKESWANLFDGQYPTVLKTGTLLSGKVTDTDGNPIAGVMLRMGSDYSNAHADVPVTDADGNFRFPHCVPGTNPVTTWKDGFAPELQNVTIADQPVEIAIQLKPPKTIKIQAVDPGGKPVAGVFIAPDTWREHRSLQFAREYFQVEYSTTDEAGLWVWPNAPADEIQYNGSKRGWRSVSCKPFLPGDDIQQMILRPELVASGTVVDAETGDAIPEFEFIPGSDWHVDQDRRKKGTDGKFKFAFDDSGNQRRLRFEAKGYEPEIVAVKDNPTNAVEFNVRMQRLEKPCFAVVTNQAGEPEPNARLIIATEDNHAYIRANLQSDQNRGTTLTTDELGRAELPSLNEPCTIIAVSKTGFALMNVAASELRTGEVRIKTTSTTRIEGTMKHLGVAMPDELIGLQFDDRNGGSLAYFDFDVRTDAEGRFVFEQVPSGKGIRVNRSLVERNGAYSTRRPDTTAILTTQPGETVNLELGRVGKYRIHGKVAYDDGKGTAVDWTKYYGSLSEDRESKRQPKVDVQYLPVGVVRLQADGSFEVNDLDEGAYQIYFGTSRAFKDTSTTKKVEHGSTRQSFTFPLDNGEDELDLGTMTIYPDQSVKQPRFQPLPLMIADIVNQSLTTEGEFELQVTTKDRNQNVIPGARVTLWYGNKGPAQQVTKIADATGVAAFQPIPSHGAWMFVEANGFRFYGQIVDAQQPGSVAKSTVRLMSDADVPTALTTLPMRVTPEVHAAAMSSLAEFAADAMAGKVQMLRQDVERLLGRYSPELAITTHQSNTIDFGGVTNEPQKHQLWHETVIYSFAANALLISDPAAAEGAIEMVKDAPSRSRVYSTAAEHLPTKERGRAIKWLKIAESLAREPGKEMLPLGERLANIAGGYRHHGADADAWRVLKEAAIEATKNPDSDRFEFGKRQVAKHLAAYDSVAALILIGFDFDNPRKGNIDISALAERVKSANPDSKEYKQLIAQIRDYTSQDEQLGDVTVTMAGIRPDVAESFLLHLRVLRDQYAPKVVHRLASADPVRAIRIAEQTTNESYKGQAFGAIADSIADLDRDRARQLIRRAFEILAAAKTPEDTRLESPLKMAVSLLPTVEKIDKALMSEYIYRTLALRRTTTCGGNCCVPINTLGRTGERNLVRLSDPVLAAAIARYDMSLARKIASASGDMTLQLSIKEAPYFLLGAMARTNPEDISFGAINKIESFEALDAWKQILPALTMNNADYWSWLMDEQFGVWEIGKAE